MKNKKLIFWGAGIIILVLLYYFFFAKKDQSKAAPAEPAANPCGENKFLLSDAEYQAKINLIKQQIQNSATWTAQINEKLGQSWHPCGGLTFEQCAEIEAAAVLDEQGYRQNPAGGWCKIV